MREKSWPDLDLLLATNGDDYRWLFAYPGIWQRWKGPANGPNVELDIYSFMTTAPNILTVSINHEEAEFDTWLSGTRAEAIALARSFYSARMQIVQSGKD
jgi:putative SOS response-associated peptidase YedK